VVAFGDVRSASVATLGLNPSRVEFLDRRGDELTGRDRRLETLRSLGVDDLSTASDAAVAQVFSSCNAYFHRNPYRGWFDQLESILAAVGASYYSGSACHLDLVQWATDPVWGQLRPASVRQDLVEDDAGFLMQQLENEQIRLLLLNGKGVADQFEQALGTPMEEVSQIPTGRAPARISVGTTRSGVLVIGWSTNLQSSFGVTNVLRKQIARHVTEFAGRHRAA
jgi:hypothetical protein